MLGNGHVVWLCLGREFPRAHWHLQHGRMLPWAQFRHLDDLAVRHESVMVDTRLILIDLPEASHLVREPFIRSLNLSAKSASGA
jgi:hypothetical protein